MRTAQSKQDSKNAVINFYTTPQRKKLLPMTIISMNAMEWNNKRRKIEFSVVCFGRIEFSLLRNKYLLCAFSIHSPNPIEDEFSSPSKQMSSKCNEHLHGSHAPKSPVSV